MPTRTAFDCELCGRTDAPAPQTVTAALRVTVKCAGVKATCSACGSPKGLTLTVECCGDCAPKVRDELTVALRKPEAYMPDVTVIPLKPQ